MRDHRVEKAKVLIAEGKQREFSSSTYEIRFAQDGPDCLAKIASFKPDLLILNFFLPKMHAIEILKKTKIPAIITCSQPLIQNYRSAIDAGAAYFLVTPYESKELLSLIDQFFARTLKIPSFTGCNSAPSPAPLVSLPSHPPSYLKFWGTRGSAPVSGPAYVQHGGNTSCLEVRHGKDLLIIDGGSALRALGQHLLAEPLGRLDIFLGHTHWDHLEGLPFFAPLYQKGREIHLWAPVGFERSAKEAFSHVFNYSYFPVRKEDIQSTLVFHDLRDGDETSIGSIRLATHYAYHPGSTLCFKITIQDQSWGYASDNELLMGYQGDPALIQKDHPLLAPHLSLISFFKECQTVIHEAQYTFAEYQHKIGWGHSSVPNATAVMQHIQPQEWIVTHHDPSHTDEELQKKLKLHQELLSQLKCSTQVRFAHDGLLIPVKG